LQQRTPAQKQLASLKRTSLEDAFLKSIRMAGLPEPMREHRFAFPCRWRFDFAWLGERLAVEVEGGTWIQGGHVRGKPYEENCRKYNEAVLINWRVLRFTTDMVRSLEAASVVKKALGL
jgi:very-short-patch-repair endonuclease